MSTLEIACGNCAKRFRVRAEFAGRSTRCPGCSSPITVGANSAPVAPRPRDEDDAPRPKQRRRSKDDDGGPVQSTLDWKATATALGREQLAIIFVFLSILGDLLVACIASMAGPMGSIDGPMPIIVILFGILPALFAVGFGLMARISAMGVPRETYARGSAVASMLCSLGGLVCLAGFGLTLLMNMEGGGRAHELPLTVSGGGLVLSGIASLLTFVGFTAQVGIYRKSAGVSRAVGRMAITIGVCSLVILGIGVLYSMISEMTGPSYRRGSPYGGGYYYEDHSGFYRIVILGLIPISIGITLILYHRMLAAAKRSIAKDAPREVND